MEHLEILYFIITFLIGIISLGFTVFFSRYTEDADLKPFIYFYSSFTILVSLNFVGSYLRANVQDYEGPLYYLILYLENPVFLIIMMFTIPYFIHSLIDLPNREKRNRVFGIIAIFVFVVHNALMFLETRVFELDNFAIFKNFVFAIIIIYAWIVLLKNRSITESSFLKNFAIYWGLIIPVVINDVFLLNTTGVKIFPLIYCVVGVVFARYYQKLIFRSPPQLIKKSDTNISTTFGEKYGLSTRELEVIKLLIEGKSYKEISGELFISLNTVKTHIRNIYPKLNVSSRHEIPNLFNNLNGEQAD